MENEALYQLSRFAFSLVWGVVVGVFYEAGGCVRMLGRFWLTAASDVFFWLVTSAATFLFFLYVNGGDMNGYLLFAVFAGAVAVRLTLGSVSDAVGRRVADWLRKRRRRRKAARAEKKRRESGKILPSLFLF
ncbi:MAG: hypothetical protein DBY36_06600 [Clostridiales bacterium]|nr:MAG: hypothetical protein DBY36_06600 [Clostridiales bacterium]